MIIFDYRPPSPDLKEFVRLYQIVGFEFSDTTTFYWKPYWPRPENCLQFYPDADSERIKYADGRQEDMKSRSTVWGQFCHLIDRRLCGKFLMLQVVFQPGALFRLTGIPSNLLTNTFVDGEAIFSSEINRVNERLSSTDNPSEMIEVVERFLRYLVSRVKHDARPIDKTGHYLLQYPKNAPLDWLAREACLSRKQFYRNFVERMGVSPKLFARIVQLDKAVKLKNTDPDTDWSSIAIDLGYYDYQHLTRDFKEFTGLTPKAFYGREAEAPERQFGKSEL